MEVAHGVGWGGGGVQRSPLRVQGSQAGKSFGVHGSQLAHTIEQGQALRVRALGDSRLDLPNN